MSILINKLTKNRGFTLIEMLVVVAVIGILSTVLLNALGPAREKAKDARIVQEVNQVRNIAEIFYIQSGNYAQLEEITKDTNLETIQNPNLKELALDIQKIGGQLIIFKSGDNLSYIAYSKLNSKIGEPPNQQINYYCVDNEGRTLYTTNEAQLQKPLGDFSKITCLGPR